MPRCANCNYELVLLEYRRKYKCAKCGRLFLQSEIDTKDFREQNKKEREQSRKQYKKETSDDYNARKAIPKIIEQLKNPKIEKTREEYNQAKREYWAKNKTHLQQKRKENYERQKLRILSTQALYRQNHKIEIRIKHLRDTQKALAVTKLKLGEIRVYNTEFDNLLPTILLS